MRLNALRAEAIAYHNLDLSREAYRCCIEAEATPAFRTHGGFWMAHLYRDKLNILSTLPRFTLSEAEGLLWQATQHIDDPHTEVMWTLQHTSLARCYLQYGNHRNSARVLRELADHVSQTTALGPLHRTIFYQTYARLCWQQQDATGWRYWITRALQLATQAGLAHQVGKIRGEYGAALDPLTAAVAGAAPGTRA